MEFCEKCGGVILVKDNKALCASCGHKLKRKPKIEALEKTNGKESIAIIKEEADITLPQTEIECPKCKNKKAYFWTMQTRASDEAETKFYKCTKCKYTWRKYR
ncbi:MAG: transcription factor S [Candidatus Pacearchaeota archaeon]